MTSLCDRLVQVSDLYAREEFDVLIMGGGLWDALNTHGDVGGGFQAVAVGKGLEGGAKQSRSVTVV